MYARFSATGSWAANVVRAAACGIVLCGFLVVGGTSPNADGAPPLEPKSPPADSRPPATEESSGPAQPPIHHECDSLGMLVAPSPGCGLFVLAVAENSAAARSGIQFGDYLRSVHGTKVSRGEDLEDELKKHQRDQTIMVGVWHRGADYEVSLKLGEEVPDDLASRARAPATSTTAAAAPQQNAAGSDGSRPAGTGEAWLGIALSQRDDRQGALLERIFPAGPADVAGLLPGDRVVAVGETAVATTDDLLALLDQTQRGTQLPLVIRRGERELKLSVTAATRADFLQDEEQSANASTASPSQPQPEETAERMQETPDGDYDNYRRMAQHSQRLEQMMWKVLDELSALRADVQDLREHRPAAPAATGGKPAPSKRPAARQPFVPRG